MNIVENNVHNQKWPMDITDGTVQVRFLTFSQKHARNWSLRLTKEGIESNTNKTRNQLYTSFLTSTLSFMWLGVDLKLKGKNIFWVIFCHFGGSSTYESKYFCPDMSVWAENLPGTLFLYEESEKMVPSRSVDLPVSNMGGFYRYWLFIAL